MGKAHYTIQDMHEFAASLGGVCLSSEFVNTQTPLRWGCTKGHTWENPFRSQRSRRKMWCVWCDGTGVNRHLTAEQHAEIHRRYEAGDRVRDIAADHGINHASARQIAVKLGAEPREPGSWLKANLDETRFDGLGPDGDNEALYWAGFLMADGCVNDRKAKPTHEPTISLSLQARDAAHVMAFREFLASGHKLGHPTSPNSPQVSIAVTSAALASALAKVGVVPRKARCTKALAGVGRSRHFWRGAIDGDGTIQLVKTPRQTRPYINLVGGSEDLLQQLYDFANANVPAIGKFQTRWADRRPNWHNGCGKAHFGGERALRLMKLLYQDCVPAAQRGRGKPIALARKLKRVRDIEASWTPKMVVREVDSEEAARMRACGVPVKQIAAHFGVSGHTIYLHLKLLAEKRAAASL